MTKPAIQKTPDSNPTSDKNSSPHTLNQVSSVLHLQSWNWPSLEVCYKDEWGGGAGNNLRSILSRSKDSTEMVLIISICRNTAAAFPTSAGRRKVSPLFCGWLTGKSALLTSRRWRSSTSVCRANLEISSFPFSPTGGGREGKGRGGEGKEEARAA